MEVKLLQSEEILIYENFIKQFKLSFFYSIKYKRLLEELLECKSKYYIVIERDSILAVLPLMYKDGKYGRIYNSLPFYGSHGGILSKSHEATKMLIEKFNKISKQKKTAINMFVENPLHKLRLSPLYDFTDIRIGQFTPIESGVHSEEELMLNFKDTKRRNIKKAIKNGIKVFIQNDAFNFLKNLHIDNMREINGRAKPDRFFDLIIKYFRPNIDFDIYVAKKDNILIAGLLIFYHGSVVEYFIPVIKRDYRTFQPLSLIILKAMINSALRGYKLWNWGGTWLSQEGVYRFKKGFGTFEIEYKYYIKVNNKEILKASKEELLEEYGYFYTIPFRVLEK